MVVQKTKYKIGQDIYIDGHIKGMIVGINIRQSGVTYEVAYWSYDKDNIPSCNHINLEECEISLTKKENKNKYGFYR